MATTLYPTKRALDTQFFARAQGTWDDAIVGSRPNALVDHTFFLHDSKDGGGTINANLGTLLASGGVFDLALRFVRFVSRPLSAQSLSGCTLQIILGASPPTTTGAGITYQWKLHVWLARYDTTYDVWLPVATLLDNYVNPTALTDDGVARFSGLDAAQALTDTAVQAGDRIVVEVGQQYVNPNPIPDVGSEIQTLRLYFGTANTSGTGQADAADGDTTVTTEVGSLTFSQTLTFEAEPSAPANDACADAEVIAALPFETGPVAASASTDTKQYVWYEWTADEDCRIYISTFGSPVGANPPQVDVFTGACGSLSAVTQWNGSDETWVGMGQTAQAYEVTSGTTYRIRVSAGGANPFNASDVSVRAGTLYLQVWKVSLPPQRGDVYVNCQHIVAVREVAGTLRMVNLISGLFSFTPTGSAIDYTEREMIKGGFPPEPHTAHRLMVVTFDFSLVEILNITEKTFFDDELAFIDFENDPPSGAVPETTQASLVFDRAGNLTVGFFGDNYSVIGGTSSPEAMWPRTLNPLVNSEMLDSGGFAAEVLDHYEVEQEVQGSEYVDIASDQRTLWYTSAGRRILRFDVVSKGQLADFATLPAEVGQPRPGVRGLRLLPPGDGTGGLLVTDGTNVKRLNASGTVIQVYTPDDPYRAGDLDKVELTPDADAFWVSDQLATVLYKFDLATGAQLAAYPLNLPTGQLCGFSVYQGYRAGLQEPPEPPVEPPAEAPPHGCPDIFPHDPGSDGGGCPVPFFP